MSSFLSGRSALQLRVRHNILLKSRLSATWSVGDDKKLLQVMANQDKKDRANFSTATSHFPGKTRQNVRSRYNTLMKWIEHHPESAIEIAPRCGPRRLAHGEPTSNLSKAVLALQAKMNERIQKSLNDKKCNQLSRKSSLIDDSEKCKKLSKESSDTSIMSTITTANKIKKRQRRRGGNGTNVQIAKDSLQMLQVQDQLDFLPKFDKSRAIKTYSKKK